MRLLWTCILATGLFLVGLEVYDSQTTPGTTTTQGATVTALEDGMPMPTPTPPKKTQ
ncbi:MAG TPA: hypothetical protein VMX54_06745 [Vicinamibacteria bacterium]|nr:hypothetical protein [Vicinamibacteria bacterium]